MIETDFLNLGGRRLLESHYRLMAPLNKSLSLLVASGDVLHSFAVPSLGVKIDGVPGRLNNFLFECNRTGIFFGQCSELCGVGHGYMPISIEVDSAKLNSYTSWLQL